MLDTIYFNEHQSSLRHAALTSINRIASRAKAGGSYKIQVKAYAEPAGDIAYNRRLACRRAIVVKQYMMAIHLDSNRITWQEYSGEGKPGPANAANHSLNQRVEIKTVVYDTVMDNPMTHAVPEKPGN